MEAKKNWISVRGGEWRTAARALVASLLLGASAKSVWAGFLFTNVVPNPSDAYPREEFIVPTLDYANSLTEYSEWNVFYAPHANNFADPVNTPAAVNYPDVFAPNGGYQSGGLWFPQSRAQANATYPGAFPNNSVYRPGGNDSSLPGPLAFWHLDNPTITQNGTSTAFVTSTGNIYSFAGTTKYQLSDTTPYTANTVVFQIQTDGSPIDYSTLRLVSGNTVLYAMEDAEFLREYKPTQSTDPSAAGSYIPRMAVQWDLRGLNITSYQILWDASSSSMSLQQASLDTSNTYVEAIPSGRTWDSGNGDWSDGTKWEEDSTTVANGNVTFKNSGVAAVNLNSSRVIGEMFFKNAANVTISSSAGATLTSNTGISTTTAATGTYTINSNYIFGSTNMMSIAAGTVRMNGVLSGNYALVKTGAGTLILSNNNTFGTDLDVRGGVLRLEGSNSYVGATLIYGGKVVVAGSNTLGNGTSAVMLGSIGGTSTVELDIEGNRTVSKNIMMGEGSALKRLAASSSAGGSGTFSGQVTLGGIGSLTSANNVRFTARTATDTLTLSGVVTGGHADSQVQIDGAGTVVYSGAAAKNYSNATQVNSGTLRIAQNATFTGNGAMTVNQSARLIVDGTLGGSGASATLSMNQGLLGGSGVVNRSFVVDAGDIISPGNSVGRLTIGQAAALQTVTFGSGGTYNWEMTNAAGVAGTDWDHLQVFGQLAVTATALDPFTIALNALTSSNFNPMQDRDWVILSTSGGITGFNANSFDFDTSEFDPSILGNFSVLTQNNNLVLRYVHVVPEPGRAILLLAGLVFTAMRRRRVISA